MCPEKGLWWQEWKEKKKKFGLNSCEQVVQMEAHSQVGRGPILFAAELDVSRSLNQKVVLQLSLEQVHLCVFARERIENLAAKTPVGLGANGVRRSIGRVKVRVEVEVEGCRLRLKLKLRLKLRGRLRRLGASNRQRRFAVSREPEQDPAERKSDHGRRKNSKRVSKIETKSIGRSKSEPELER